MAKLNTNDGFALEGRPSEFSDAPTYRFRNRTAGNTGILDQSGENSGARRSLADDVAEFDQASDDMAGLNRALLSLQSAVSAIASSLDMRHVLDTFAWEMANLLDAPACSIFDWDQDSGCIILLAAFQDQEWTHESALGGSLEAANYPPVMRVLRERYAQQLNRNQSNIDFHLTRYMAEENIESLLMLPMVFQDRVVGLTQVIERQAGRIFTEQEISLAQLLTNQAASTIVNARLYDKLVETNAALETSNAELDAFAHTVAHDLKAPLSYLLGFAEILQEESAMLSAQETRDSLSYIVNGGQKMVGIIDALLLFARTRREEVELAPVDMNSVIMEAQASLADLIEENAAEIVTPSYWPGSWGYAPWLEEVWVNLLSNAIKYGGSPPLVEIGATEQDSKMVRFWVHDNGHGLNAEQQAQLFKPFSRVNRTPASGHGLGLSIVHRIVDRLGGEVGVESEVGQGSLFYFTLPACHETSSVRDPD